MANLPNDENCTNCGTPLMLMVVPPSFKHESVWDNYSEEHLLERISHLELRLMQVTDRLSKVLDLMLKQSQTVQREHLLVETLIEALESAKIIENGQITQVWRDRQKEEARKLAATEKRDRARDSALTNTNGIKLDLFTNLVKEGFHLIEQGEETNGLRTLERAAGMSAENFPLLAYIAEHYFRADKRLLAREYLEKAYRLEPKDSRIALLLGIVLADEGKLDFSRKLLEQASEVYGFAANLPLGLIYAAENNFDKALAAFKVALNTKSCAESFYFVGCAYVALEDENKAVKHLQKATEKDANFADAWFMLGAVYLKMNDENSARAAFSRALSAKDAGAQCQAFLRGNKKNIESSINLLFLRLSQNKDSLIATASPRFVKILREELDSVLTEHK